LEQRNELGGFISTQDTIVGITALAEFGKLISSPFVNMEVSITYEGGSHSFQLNNENAITLQEFAVSILLQYN